MVQILFRQGLILLLVSTLGVGQACVANPALTLDSYYASPGEPFYREHIEVFLGADGRVSWVDWVFESGKTESTFQGRFSVTWGPNSVAWSNEDASVRGSATWSDREVSWTEFTHSPRSTPPDSTKGGRIRFDPTRPEAFSDDRWDYQWTSLGGYQQWPRGSRDPRPGDGFTTSSGRLVFWVNGHESEVIELRSRPGLIEGRYLSAPEDAWVPAGTVTVKGGLRSPSQVMKVVHFVLMRRFFALPVWAGAVFESPSQR